MNRTSVRLGILLAVVASLGVTACGGSDENPVPDADAFTVGDGSGDTDPDVSFDVPQDAAVDIVPDVPPPNCGNGQLDPGEACDGDLLGGAACDDFGFASGSLGCTASCERDTSGCSEDPGPLCGDGVIEGDEVCDGSSLGELTCADVGGFGDGVGCSDACEAQLGTCRPEAVCGDGFRDGDEECDDANPEADDGCSDTCVVEDCHRAIRLDWYLDTDGDGVGSGEPVAACAAPGPRSVNVGGDCDDEDPSRFPGNPERCDAVDNDCDDDVDEEAARVGEVCASGLPGACEAAFFACAGGELYCRPLAAATPERCDGLDNDCDGDVDENADGSALSRSCYTGAEGTLGVGVCATGTQTCADAAWLACQGPTLPTDEVCNGLDDDCDGEADEGIASSTWFRDVDGDGFGDAGAATITVDACAAPDGYAEAAGDCDDADELVHPDADERCDGIDNNCDDVIDTDALSVGDACDTGRDGVCSRGRKVCVEAELSCAQTDYATAELCNGQDDDCDGATDEGADGEPLARACYGADPATAGVGVCARGEQACAGAAWQTCVDEVLPSGEVCDGLDNDCDGGVDEGAPLLSWYADNDGDGWGTGAAVPSCLAPGANYVTQTGDCFDGNDEVSPGTDETLNGTDDNCDGRIDEGTPIFDDDGDGFCEAGPCVGGLPDGDCDDRVSSVYPGGTELLDGLDNDCDGEADNRTPTLDDDGDGYCEIAPCVTGTLGGGDCNDHDALIYPGAPEQDNGIDDNCNGVIDDRKTWLGGDPSAPSSWGVAANWSPVGVPGTTDDVFIPVRPNQPFLVANSTITSLRVQDGAVLDLSGFTLTIREDLDAGHTIIGAGSIVLTGAAARLSGTVSNLSIQGNVTLSGDTTVTGNLSLANAAALYVGGHELVVGGNLSLLLRNGAGLRMLEPDDYVTVGGTATFHLEVTTSAVAIDALRAGTLELRGDLVQTDAGTPVDVWAFAPAGTTVVFAGASPQTVSFETPGLLRSRLDDVVIADGASVTFATSAWLTTLRIEGSGSVTGADLHFDGELPALVPTYLVADTHIAADMVLGAEHDGYDPAQLTVDAGADVQFSGPVTLATPVDVAGTLSSGAHAVLIADRVQVLAGGQLRAGAGGLDLGENLINAGTVQVDGALLDVAGDLSATGAVAVGSGTLSVGGALAIQAEGSVALGDGGLDVLGATTISGARSRLDAGAGTVDLAGLTVTANNALPSGLIVSGDALVTVTGDALFTSVASALDTAPNLTGGTLRFRRNFSSLRPCGSCDRTFAAAGTRVVFDGTVAQTILFESPGAASGRFADVEFRNPAGVAASSSVWVTGQATLAAGTLDAADVYLTSLLPVLADGTNWSVDVTHVAGNAVALPSTVTLPMLQVDAGATLTLVEPTTLNGPLSVLGTVAQRGLATTTSGSVDITGLWLVEGGSWTATAPVQISGASGGIIVGGGNATLNSLRIAPSSTNLRGLVMTNPADRVTIEGALTVNEQGFYGGNTDAALTAGELRVRGNVTQTGAIGSSGRSLSFNGTRLVLDGALLQTVAIGNNGATLSRFSDVVVANPNGVTFNSISWITGRLTVSAGASCSGTELVITRLLPILNGSFAVGRLRINAGAFVPDLASFAAPRLAVDAGSMVTLAQDLTMTGALEVSGTFGAAGHDLVVNGALDVTGGSVDLGGGELTVSDATVVSGDNGAIFASGGRANFASYRQWMRGNNSLGLVMRNPLDRVYVAGSFVSSEENFYAGTTEGAFTAGELHVRGNFSQTAATGSNNRAFLTSGTTVYLDGTGSQTVSLAGNSTSTSHFGDLVVSTPGGVVFGSAVWIDGILTVAPGSTVSGTDVVFTEHLPRINGTWSISRASLSSIDFVPDLPSLNVPILQVRGGSTLRLGAAFDLSGTLDVRGTVNLTGQPLDVGGNLEIVGGSVDTAGATLYVANDLGVGGSGATFSVNGGQVTVGRDLGLTMSEGSSGVVMTAPGDRLTVGRDFTVVISNLSNATTEGRFTSGVLSVGRNVTAHDGIANTGRTLVLTGTRLVLTGTGAIAFGANGPALSRLDAVDIEPGAAVSLSSNVYSTGAWSVAGGLTVGSSRTLTTTGAITIQPTGTLNLAGTIVAASCTNDGGTITGGGAGCPAP